MHGLCKKNLRKLTQFLNATFSYIDDVLSVNNSEFGDYVDEIHVTELETKDTKDTATFASYLTHRH